jgi:ribonuclease P protein component
MGGDGKFDRDRRLKGAKAFARVFGAKRSAANELLIIYAFPNGLRRTRLGLTVGRRHGNAVRRNRIKRLLREAFRLESDALSAGFDLIGVPKVGRTGTLSEYREAIRAVATRAIGRSRVDGNRR